MLLVPFILVASLIFCNKPASMIPDTLYEDVKLHHEALPADFNRTYKRRPILDMTNTPFTGTQSMFFKIDDRLHSTQTYEVGYLTERIYFDKAGSQIIRYVFEYQDGFQTSFQQYDQDNNIVQQAKSTVFNDGNKILFTRSKQWYPNGQLRFDFSFVQTSERPAVYDGLMSHYDEQGLVLEQELYKDGELLEKIK